MSTHHGHCKQSDTRYLLTSFHNVASPGDKSSKITTITEITIRHSRGTVRTEAFCATPDTVLNDPYRNTNGWAIATTLRESGTKHFFSDLPFRVRSDADFLSHTVYFTQVYPRISGVMLGSGGRLHG